jgi:hypothetical protein
MLRGSFRKRNMDDEGPMTFVAIVVWEMVALFFIAAALFGFVTLVVLQAAEPSSTHGKTPTKVIHGVGAVYLVSGGTPKTAP